jgi:hypothetical protein
MRRREERRGEESEGRRLIVVIEKCLSITVERESSQVKSVDGMSIDGNYWILVVVVW